MAEELLESSPLLRASSCPPTICHTKDTLILETDRVCCSDGTPACIVTQVYTEETYKPVEHVAESNNASWFSSEHIVPLCQALLGEFVGVFILVGLGCGGVAVGNISKEGVSILFGFIVLALIQALGPISGAHLNPAVTFCICLSRKMDILTGLLYVPTQLAGALLGAVFVRDVIPGSDVQKHAMTRLRSDVTVGQGLVLEIVMTASFLLVIYSTSQSRRCWKKFAPIPIAVMNTALILFGADLTGTSLNPARSLGPAIVAGDMQHQWVFVVGPLVGAAIGWACYQVLHFNASTFTKKDKDEYKEL
eukprot:Colp12_sorted_trinity150504_noHs@29980